MPDEIHLDPAGTLLLTLNPHVVDPLVEDVSPAPVHLLLVGTGLLSLAVHKRHECLRRFDGVGRALRDDHAVVRDARALRLRLERRLLRLTRARLGGADQRLEHRLVLAPESLVPPVHRQR